MADVSIKSLGEEIPTDDWQLKGFEAVFDNRTFLLLMSGPVMKKAEDRSYASSRLASSVWSMTAKAVLEDAAGRKLARDGFPGGGRLTLTPDDIA